MPKAPRPKPARAKPFRFEVFGLSSWHGPLLPMLRVHSHAEVELNLIESGRLTYRFGEREIRLNAGTLAVFSGASAHELAGTPPKDTRFFWLTVPIQSVLEWELPVAFTRALWRGEVALSRHHDHAHDLRLFTRWNDDLKSGDKSLTPIVLLEVHARLARLARDFLPAADRAKPIARAHAHGTAHVAAMVRVILEHFQEPLWLADIAEPTNLHPDRASHLFHRELGVTPREFLRRQRLVHAQRLLTDTDRTITAIANESGFPTMSRFYEAFTKELKMTPHAYRRGARK